jgi:hypothetical protein
MKRIAILILIFTGILFSACKNDTIWVYYDETFCSDQWGNSDISDKDKMKEVKKYLKSKQISVLKIEIIFDETPSIIMCEACHCKSGKIIKCEINEEDLEKAFKENFYINK